MLATEVPAMSENEFRAAFRGSAMKRAKLGGLRSATPLPAPRRFPGVWLAAPGTAPETVQRYAPEARVVLTVLDSVL